VGWTSLECLSNGGGRANSQREDAVRILQSVYETSITAEDTILQARDEVLQYLDGEGIEELRDTVVSFAEHLIDTETVSG